jgi:hypothetical protein
MKKSTEVGCVICPKCHDIVYSRARHDMRNCTCGEVAIDGGRFYTKLCFKKDMPETKVITVPYSDDEMFQDWNQRKNKLGIIKAKANK